MRSAKFTLVLILFSISAVAQDYYVGVFGGFSAYAGDLTGDIFPKQGSKPAVGITGSYKLNNKFTFRAGLTYGSVAGFDQYSTKEVLRNRNLSFQSSLIELSVVSEYALFSLNDNRYTPYVFGGLAVFRFNPYAYTDNNDKVYLRPLSTEGQGLSTHPDQRPYQLIQPSIPFGGGVKFKISAKLQIAAEIGLRKTFTDHIDDLSSIYVDRNALLAARGQLAVDMAYRANAETSPGYPANGTTRGNPRTKDYYYFAGLHISTMIGKNRFETLRCPE